MSMISVGSRISIDMPQEEQNLILESQTHGWKRLSALHSSQKGFLIAMGVNSIFAASLAVLEFFIPDPPSDKGPFSWWLDSAVLAKNTQKWGFLISSLLITSITALGANVFLQKNQQQNENGVTPEMAALIQSRVEEEILKLIPEINNLPT